MIKKIGLIFFGILLLVLLELSLCLLGRIFLFTRSRQDLSGHRNVPAKLICCIGDSHTFGVGASYKYSYPKQLEALLNLNNPATPFKVVNLGIPGSSTRDQIKRLSRFLNKNRVDMVILATGGNNYYEVKIWKNKSFLTKIIVKIKTMRIYRIMQYVLWSFFKIDEGENVNAYSEKNKYKNYMEYYLSRAKTLCAKHRCKLLLISYHHSSIRFIEEFAGQSGLLYFNLSRDFKRIIPQDEIMHFISRDRSHLNLYGYKVFTELLYKQMFLHRMDLNLELNPLSKEIGKDSLREEPVNSYLRYIQGKSVFY